MNETEKREIIEKLKAEREKDSGFFFDFRFSVLNKEAAERAYKLVDEIDLYHEKIDREIVSLIWDIPNFLEGNYENVVDNGEPFNDVREWCDKFTILLNDKFHRPL